LLAFVGEFELIVQIIEAVIYRGSGKHEDFGFNTGFDYPV
jgi:hypothetical protein